MSIYWEKTRETVCLPQFDDFFYLKRMQCRLETKWNSIQSAIEKLVKLTQSVLYLLQFDKF